MISRIDFIDYFKGFTIIWMAWYHTTHPDFVNYHFFVPAFFLMSGIFVKKQDWKTFWTKKWSQLIFPFLFFYLLYWSFLVVVNSLSKGELSIEYIYHITDFFRFYTGNDAYIVNYPLWFVTALIIIQLLYQTLLRITNSKYIIVFIATVISVFDLFWFQYIPTPLMIGKALKFFFYYATGATVGLSFVNYIISSNKTKDLICLLICIFIIAVCVFFDSLIFGHYKESEFNYIEISVVTFAGILICKYISKMPFFKPLLFYGRYSLIVLGLHELYLTVCRIVTTAVIGDVNILWGFINLVIVLLLLFPTIIILTKYTPTLVGCARK